MELFMGWDDLCEKSRRERAEPPQPSSKCLVSTLNTSFLVLIYGDSHNRRMEKLLADEKLGIHIECIGVGGANIRDWQQWTIKLESYHVVVIVAGGNDVTQHPFNPSVESQPVAETFRKIRACQLSCEAHSCDCPSAYHATFLSHRNSLLEWSTAPFVWTDFFANNLFKWMADQVQGLGEVTSVTLPDWGTTSSNYCFQKTLSEFRFKTSQRLRLMWIKTLLPGLSRTSSLAWPRTAFHAWKISAWIFEQTFFSSHPFYMQKTTAIPFFIRTTVEVWTSFCFCFGRDPCLDCIIRKTFSWFCSY